MAEMTVPLVSRGNGLWGSPSPAWDHLINRESSGRPTVVQSPSVVDVNTGGNEAEGLFQITPKTWQRHNGTDFAPSARRATPQQQAIVAARIFTRNPTGSDWGAGRPGRESASDLAAGLVPLGSNQPQEATSVAPMADPFTGAMWSPNRYHPRSQGNPRWIAVHTQEGGRTARDLAAFLDDPNSQVSYHAVNDDHDVLKVVAEGDAPWAAAGANGYAFHICLAGSYAAWSRGKWLETDASDGKNEDLELTNAAKIIAWWCHKYDIPAQYIGGNGIPWGKDGICGHVDFGGWGGGHHDPGQNFPFDELIRRVKSILGGTAPAPLPPPPPVGPAGGTPADPATSPYFTGLLYRGSQGPQVAELQRRLKAAYASYAGHLPIDGDFGPLTDAAVREFQRRAGLVVDGIVGTQTAAALKLRNV